MSLSRTVPLVAPGTVGAPQTPEADSLNQLLLSLDEILAARFGGKSWLCFYGAGPDLELGERFRFGAASSFPSIAAAYDYARETPAVPVGGQIISSDPATKVVWVDGYDDSPTLTRQHCTFTPSGGTAAQYWFGYTKPQRFEPLLLADITVENYTDPVASATDVFTWRSHWDRHGCIRIHNGNLFPLTLTFEDASQDDVEIPALGIVTGRRAEVGGEFGFDAYYLPMTLAGDPLRWEKPHDGQFAASLELAAGLCSLLAGQGPSGYCRTVTVTLDDQTTLDAAYFNGGTTMESADSMGDWLMQKGDILSVITDLRDGSVTTQVLTWQGFGSVPDASWAGYVLAEITGGGNFLELTSDADPPVLSGIPATEDEWEHDLIPISTNLIGITPISVKTTQILSPPSTTAGSSQPLMNWELSSTVADRTPLDYFVPFITPNSGGVGGIGGGGSAFTRDEVSLTQLPANGFTYWTIPIVDALEIPTPSAGWDEDGSGWYRCLGAVCSYQAQFLDGNHASWNRPADFAGTSEALWWVRTDTVNTMRWHRVAGFGPLHTLRHFAARIPRRYIPSSSLADQHPYDSAVLGTTDGLGGPMEWTPTGVETSPVRIECAQPNPTDTTKGRKVYLPTDALDYVLANVSTPGWWQTNRVAIMTGTVPAAAKLQTYRVAREAGEFNAYALICNSVREIRPVTISNLYKDPLPAGCNQRPFDYGDPVPFAVPGGWSCGRYETSSILKAWADGWGIPYNETPLPNLTTLRASVRKVWSHEREAVICGTQGAPTVDYPSPPPYEPIKSVVTVEIIARDYSYFTGEVTDTVNGETFTNYSDWSEANQIRLFGAAGTDDGYVWIARSDLADVFDALGVALPPDLVGEYYEPRFAVSTAPTLLTGTIVGTTSDPALAVSSEVFLSEAIRDPFSASLSWLHVIDDSQVFRLSNPTGVQGTVFRSVEYDGTGMPVDTGIPSQAFCSSSQEMFWEIGLAGDELKCTQLSSRGIIPRSTDGDGPEAWPDVASVYCSVPCLIVGTPEPLYFSTHDQASDTYNPATLNPASYQVRCLEVPASTLVDAAYLIANGWPESEAYHLQLVRRYGVVRV